MNSTLFNTRKIMIKVPGFKYISLSTRYGHSAIKGARDLKWYPGIVEDITGPVSYTVKLPDGRVVKRHVDQLRVRYESGPQPTDQSPPLGSLDGPLMIPATPPTQTLVDLTPPTIQNTVAPPPQTTGPSPPTPPTPPLRRSGRMMVKPNRLIED